jgi:hypothetical protein
MGMKFLKYGAVMIVVYLVVANQSSVPLAGAVSTGASGLVKAFQGR